MSFTNPFQVKMIVDQASVKMGAAVLIRTIIMAVCVQMGTMARTVNIQ